MRNRALCCVRRARQPALRFLGQSRVILRMAPLIVFLLPCCPQLFPRILANHFEQTIAREAISRGLHLDQTGIDKRRDGRESLIGSDEFLSSTDGLCCCQRASSHENTQRAEPALVGGSKE